MMEVLMKIVRNVILYLDASRKPLGEFKKQDHFQGKIEYIFWGKFELNKSILFNQVALKWSLLTNRWKMEMLLLRISRR